MHYIAECKIPLTIRARRVTLSQAAALAPSRQINGFSSRHPALSRGAYRDRHETWGGDAVDVEVGAVDEISR